MLWSLDRPARVAVEGIHRGRDQLFIPRFYPPGDYNRAVYSAISRELYRKSRESEIEKGERIREGEKREREVIV